MAQLADKTTVVIDEIAVKALAEKLLHVVKEEEDLFHTAVCQLQQQAQDAQEYLIKLAGGGR